LIGESKYLKVIRADQDEDINFLGDLVITQGILVKGELFIGFGSLDLEVFILNPAPLLKETLMLAFAFMLAKKPRLLVK